jgi:hypothetical protein
VRTKSRRFVPNLFSSTHRLLFKFILRDLPSFTDLDLHILQRFRRYRTRTLNHCLEPQSWTPGSVLAFCPEDVVISWWAYATSTMSSSPGRGKFFLYSKTTRLVLGPSQPPIQWVPGALSPGVERPVLEVDHSTPTSAEVKNTWFYTSSPPYVFIAKCLNQLRYCVPPDPYYMRS